MATRKEVIAVRRMLAGLRDSEGERWFQGDDRISRVEPVVYRGKLPKSGARAAAAYSIDGGDYDLTYDGISPSSLTIDIAIYTTDHSLMDQIEDALVLDIESLDGVIGFEGPTESWDEELQAYQRVYGIDFGNSA